MMLVTLAYSAKRKRLAGVSGMIALLLVAGPTHAIHKRLFPAIKMLVQSRQLGHEHQNHPKAADPIQHAARR